MSSSTISSREPKVILDLRNIVKKLSEEFQESNEPISDDNNFLHILKNKNVFGQTKTYWQWIYSCLRKNRSLNDSLKYVQANNELRSSTGRGRSLIRYCLVHHCLADSLQTCLMEEHLNNFKNFRQNSILIDPNNSSSLLTSLYDLNAVHFDLNSKGYDLDSGWPTFSSKRTYPRNEHWAVDSQVPLGSLPPPSVIMGSRVSFNPADSLMTKLYDVRDWCQRSSGPPSAPSVDQRVEELVLELDQSDRTIKHLKDTIQSLEAQKDSFGESTMEKENILASVITDLEAKNRHLQDVMSKMTSEYQSRDDELLKQLRKIESEKTELMERNKQLADDKYTLQETISCQMTAVTRAFGSRSEDLLANERSLYEVKSSTPDPEIKELEELKWKLQHLDHLSSVLEKIISYRVPESDDDLKRMRRNMNEDLMEDALKIAKDLCEKKIHQSDVLDQLSFILDLNLENLEPLEQNNLIIDTIKDLKRDRSICEESSNDDDTLRSDRDVAIEELATTRRVLISSEDTIKNLKLELELQQNQSKQQMIELEEKVSILTQKNKNLIFQQSEILSDLRTSQDTEKNLRSELERFSMKSNLLEEHMVEKSENDEERFISLLESELEKYKSSSSNLHQQLKLETNEVDRLKNELGNSQNIIEDYICNYKQIQTQLSFHENKNLELKQQIDILIEEKLQANNKIEQLKAQINEETEITKNLTKSSIEFCRKFKKMNENYEVDNFLQDEILSEYEHIDRIGLSHLTNELDKILQQFSTLKDVCKSLENDLEAKQNENSEILNQLIAELASLDIMTEGSDEKWCLKTAFQSLIKRYKEDLENCNSDINQMKEKLLQLIQDKDEYWQAAHSLKSQLHEDDSINSETSTSLLGSLMYSASGVESMIGGINNIVSVFTTSNSRDAKDDGDVVVEAGKAFHLPVLVEEIGMILKWVITSDLDISFGVHFAESEESPSLSLIDLKRIDCHKEPHKGHVIANQVGIYTLIFDNSYSRFTAKRVKYKLEVTQTNQG